MECLRAPSQIRPQRHDLEKDVPSAIRIPRGQRALPGPLLVVAGTVGGASKVPLPTIPAGQGEILAHGRTHRITGPVGLSVDDAIGTAVGATDGRPTRVQGTAWALHGPTELRGESAAERLGGDTTEELQPKANGEALTVVGRQDKGAGGDRFRVEFLGL